MIKKSLCFLFIALVFIQITRGQDYKEIRLLLNSLDTTQSPFYKILVLRDIAEIGSKAYYAGKEVEKYLNNKNWDLRVASARTLGYINYVPAIPGLIKALNCDSDWRLSYVSVLSLGMMHAKEALPKLKEIENSFWYSIVREAAKNSISAISDPSQHHSDIYYPNFAFEFFSYEGIGEEIENCFIKKDEEQKRIPFINGFLIGTDNGEWGGTLSYLEPSGNQIDLLNDNIKSLNVIGKNTIAIAGLAHLSFNKGTIYLIQNTESTIIIKEILILPGAPISIKRLKTKDLMITTFGGTVILSKDLKLRQAACNEE